MDWTRYFYSTTGRWWGPAESAITERDRDRAALIRRIAGPGAATVLELGCGYGNTAATANAGFRVVGVDISEARLEFVARLPADISVPGSLRFVRSDFYEFTPDERFDVVCYFNGFGIGTDADQRRLRLRRPVLVPTVGAGAGKHLGGDR